uniref:Protein lin-54 n=1 Tax=Ascaris suum TaxID=6253 RepID=F1L2W3_ASCSU
MDHGQQIVQEEVVEEVIDDGTGEIYEEMIEVEEGDEMMLEEVEEISVDDVDYAQVSGSGGYQYVVQSVPSQLDDTPVTSAQQSRLPVDDLAIVRAGHYSTQYVQQQPQQERPLQSQHVYAIRGSQVYRMNKAGGIPVAIHPVQLMHRPNENIPLRHPEERQRSGRATFYPHISTRVQATEPRVPIAFRTAEAAYQQNRLLTPFLAARMVHQKKRQSGIGIKKPCNCTKSMCLKLYCDCFANGEFCKDCNCKDCHNNLDNEAERSRAIKASLERNPNAFKPKIGVASRGRVDSERLHQKGCHCKKSNCLKNYCECYEAKVPCTERCKCSSCRNTESDRASKFRGKFGVGADVRHLSCPPSTEQRIASPFSDEESDADSPEPSDPKTLPWFYMTDEVVEAATLCLVAQAEEVESSGNTSEEQLEKAVLEEFGRCLGQVIENASKTAVTLQ